MRTPCSVTFLSGSVDVAVDNSLRYEHALVLRQEWGATQAGTVLLEPCRRAS
jgi:hypothetical protein